MNLKRTVGLALAATVLTLAIPAMQAEAYGPPVVIARPAPPPERIETPPPPPGPRWYWQRGHWRWAGNRWVWVRGHYIRPR